jgi:hypothetical protein
MKSGYILYFPGEPVVLGHSRTNVDAICLYNSTTELADSDLIIGGDGHYSGTQDWHQGSDSAPIVEKHLRIESGGDKWTWRR